MNKICPIKQNFCKQEQCAWWSSITKNCIILTWGGKPIATGKVRLTGTGRERNE